MLSQIYDDDTPGQVTCTSLEHHTSISRSKVTIVSCSRQDCSSWPACASQFFPSLVGDAR